MVCEALGRGEQSIMLRKGGIAEGRAGFGFKHPEFYLFPTFFHEQLEKTRSAVGDVAAPRSDEIEIRWAAKLELATVVTDWETAVALEPFHILQRELVRERFEYDAAPGIHVAVVRVFRLQVPWSLPDLPAYGGCRSWVNLPDVPQALDPVLTDEEHARKLLALQAILPS